MDHHVGFALVVCLTLATSPAVAADAARFDPGAIGVFAQSVIDTLPPEFAADLLIRIADSQAGIKAASRWREQLYGNAFQLAAGAPEPIKLTAPGSQVDSRAGMIADGFRCDIDRLSLRSRAVKGLFPLQPEKARQLADAIDIAVPALTCADTMVPDPSAVYDLARVIASGTRRRDEPLVERLISGIRSSAEVAPAVKLIRSIGLGPQESSTALIVNLSGILTTLFDDDVTFSTTLSATSVHVLRLVEDLENLGEDSLATTLLGAYRSYLVGHLSGERCALGDRGPTYWRSSVQAYVDKGINPLLERHNLAVMSPAEVMPKATRPAAANVLLFQSPTPKKLLRDIQALRFTTFAGRASETLNALRSTEGRERSIAEKQRPEWTEALDHFYAELAVWKPSTDARSAADYFHERCILLMGVFEIVPSDTERRRALDELIAFLAGEGYQRFRRIEWFGHVRAFVSAYATQGEDREWVLRRLRESGDPIMRAYAEVEELLNPARASGNLPTRATHPARRRAAARPSVQ